MTLRLGRRRAQARAPRSRFSAGLIDALGRAKIIGLRVGLSPHRSIGLWVVVVQGRVFVRSWGATRTDGFRNPWTNLPEYLTIGSRRLRVRLIRTRSDQLKTAVDLAYREKYKTPGSARFVRDMARVRSRDSTTELVPLS